MNRLVFALALTSCGFPKLAPLTDAAGPGDDAAGADGPMCVGGDIHLTPTRITPAVELLLDRSGSMAMSDVAPTRYGALVQAVTDVVNATQPTTLFGAALFSGQEMPCPPDASVFAQFSVPRQPNNASAINNLIQVNTPNGNTPTADWINAVAMDFVTSPPPPTSPRFILLVTDGEPNACSGATDGGMATVAATTQAFNQGIRLFVVAIAPLPADMQFLQNLANAGAGQPGAPFFTATSIPMLEDGLRQVIAQAQPCTMPLGKTIDPTKASSGQVKLDGNSLVFGTDWKLDDTGKNLVLLGSSCSSFQTDQNATVDATFPCGSVLP
jgi:hypothetical protein